MKDDPLLRDLLYLKLAYFQEHHLALAKEAAEKNSTPLDFLSRLAPDAATRLAGTGAASPRPVPG